ncbi:KamA family radical SAM protein [Halobacteriovorax vibrionivorans]|uniref:KamA family radical SAM protein n=1 Tax=Halobacteriovorax vibrionivorans TaxID=2152716 RepID=A0ABY0IMW7_9BACT|nr:MULTISPECIES: KamA family radical SAM protein [Halobacteriovorax]RZF22582.1 KamA family radical SAM protein [Halobacteriovorax vibrionivorans]TGD47775.1 KamA family radical SAM protein [Halobacteriovorax sp. Y22]
MRKGLRSTNEVNSHFGLNLEPSSYEVFIPSHMNELIQKEGLEGIHAKQFLPSNLENSDDGLEDPIGDQQKYVAPQLIHRYDNRALFTPTTICPVICRYCFRKNELSSKHEIFKADFEKVISYLSVHTEINEIIFSGGDPFMLSASKIKFYLEEFSKLSHIQFIRFHTRTPISLPKYICDEFIEVIHKFNNRFNDINVVIHINHIQEITTDAMDCIKKLGARFSLLSQSVLLKDVNNNVRDLKDLFLKLHALNIRPYYLHHPDQAKGAMHFYLSIEEGREIYRKLRREIPGWLLPQYILDSPDGSGKKNL